MEETDKDDQIKTGPDFTTPNIFSNGPNPGESPLYMSLLLSRSFSLCLRTRGFNSLRGAAFYTKYSSRELQRIWTIPNALSMSRIIATPFLGHAVITDRPMLATSLLLLCGISDVADGYIARRFRQQSALGSILDPLGDKLLVGVLAGALVWKGLVPVWLVSMILARDFGLVTSGIYVRWKNLPSPVTWAKFVDPATATATVTPTTISKINTALQIILLGLSLTSPMLVDAYGSVVEPLLVALQYTVAVTTIWSSISYIRNFRRVIRFIKK